MNVELKNLSIRNKESNYNILYGYLQVHTYIRQIGLCFGDRNGQANRPVAGADSKKSPFRLFLSLKTFELNAWHIATLLLEKL